MPRRQAIGYVAVLAGCLLAAMAAGWTTFGVQIDNDAYDFLFRIHPPDPWPPSAAVVGIDEQTLTQQGGLRRIRGILAEGLERLREAGPKVVVVDLILADPGDAGEDAALERALAGTKNLVLASDMTPQGWEDPLPRFSRSAAAVGHVYADPDPYDNVVRQVPLEKAVARQRRWALSLEAYRLWGAAGPVQESPGWLEVGRLRIPAPRNQQQARPLLIRYRPGGPGASVPMLSLHQLSADPPAAARLAGKVVFVGITAQSAAQDRHMTPYSYGQTMAGVEIHANAFETLARGTFLRPAGDFSVAVFSILLAAAAGLAFALRSGWQSYAIGVAILAVAHLAPYLSFRNDIVFPYAAPAATAWLTLAAAATYQHFVVRRLWRRSESDRARYREAIHFVTHEMRSPLTAIQGSSELMGRYQLSDDKRAQIARLINTESRRLARMIQTFLDVERLTAGEMELRKEPYQPAGVVQSCVERARPLAERKRIRILVASIPETILTGDRELMEYAVYNLLTNAVKYSPADTEVSIFGAQRPGEWRLSVRDQGIGMDEAELRNIFRKFYRTKKAEKSGESGTGIGLSIVDQIVSHHGGKVEVTSKPGAGSCFTIVLPAPVAAAAAQRQGELT